jgi:hypothetical protein
VWYFSAGFGSCYIRILYRFTLKQEPFFTYTQLNVLRSAPEFGGLHSGCVHGLSKLVM